MTLLRNKYLTKRMKKLLSALLNEQFSYDFKDESKYLQDFLIFCSIYNEDNQR
jgi:hypothetical protein